MHLKGYRKLISAVIGVLGIVLVNLLGVPSVQVENLSQVVVEALSALAACWAIATVIWAEIAAQGRVDVAEQVAQGAQRGLPEFERLEQ